MNLTQKSLAQICSVSATRIRQLVADGVITKTAEGKYSVESVTQYIEYLRQVQQKRTGYHELLDREKYREKKRENDRAETLVAPVEVIEHAVEKGVTALIAILETLPLIIKRNWPEITGDQIQLVKQSVAECRNAMADVEIVFDDD